jgi:FkbM family methyltransferase
MQGLTAYNLKIVAEVLGGSAYPLQLLSLLGESPLVLDLGANIGSFSLACYTLRNDARLVALEPDPVNFSALKANLATTNAELHQAALGACDGEVALFLGEQDAVANSTFSGKMVSEQRVVTVQGFDTTAFMGRVTHQHGEIGLLKCDTEGGEWHLMDLPDSFLAAIPMIFLEYHSATFFEKFLPRILQSHVVFSAAIRFPHRGELALLRKDLVSGEQAAYEIRPVS